MNQAAQRTLGLTLVAAAALAATAASYRSPKASEPAATLIFFAGGNGSLSRTSYDINTAPACRPEKAAAMMGDTGMKSVRVHPGRAIMVVAAASGAGKDFTLFEDGLSLNECSARASFTPQAGRTYRLRQIVIGKACHMEVADSETGKSPPDLKLGADAVCDMGTPPR